MHVLLDQQHGDAALIDLANDAKVLFHQPRREAERRLVNQQQLGRAHQPAPDRYHGLLAARHRAGELRAPLRQAREDLKEPSIAFLLTLDDAVFRTFFSGSPVKRIGRDRFIRNVLIAAGNSGETALIEQCRGLSEDPSPVVRGMAVWALSRLMEAGEFSVFAAQRADEKDDDVLNEWRLAGVG